jgi:hypothetical protein
MLSASRILVAAAVVFCAGTAQAATIGFNVHFTRSTISLSNESDLAEITAYTIGIGDTAFNFDRVTSEFFFSGSSFVLLSPDTVDDAVRSDDLSYTFEDFAPGQRLDSIVDIDPDSGNSDSCCSIYGVMFNNGDAPNAVIAVTYSNGFILDAEIPDVDSTSGCLSGCDFPLAFDVPEPGLPLLVGGLVALALAARRRSS